MDTKDETGAMVSNARVFLVEDHKIFRRSLARVLGREPDLEVVAEAGSLADAREALSGPAGGVDVAILDLRLPDGNGADLVEDLRRANPRASVLILTASPEHARSTARLAGADGMLAKDADLAEIVGAVRRLAKRPAAGPGGGERPGG